MSQNDTEKRPVGRPSDYREEYIEQVRELCYLGATDVQLANFFKVAESTIHLWKKEHPEFSESIIKAKQKLDGQVAKSLYNRAMGYSHPEDKIFCHDGEVIVQPTVKHYPPDTQAARLWLLNRQPKEWRDKTDHEHTGVGGGPIEGRWKIEIVKPDVEEKGEPKK